MIIVPDVSHWHIVSDFAKVKEQYPFAIAKATQGIRYIDPTLKSFIAGCEKVGEPYYLYTFLTKGGELAQTKYLVSTCKPLVGSHFMGYVIDVEKENIPDSVKAALDWLSNNCSKCLFYTGYQDYKLYKDIIANLPDNCKWWEARYGKNTGEYSINAPCHTGVTLHQYSSRADLPGIKGLCDASRLISTTELSWFITSSGKAEKKEEVNPYREPIITVKKGMSGNVVRWVQWYLWKFGLLLNSKGVLSEANIDGKFGVLTEQAVKEAQKRLGLTIDGKVGAETRAAFKKVL